MHTKYGHQNWTTETETQQMEHQTRITNMYTKNRHHTKTKYKHQIWTYIQILFENE